MNYLTIKSIPTKELECVTQKHILLALNFLQYHQIYSNFQNAKTCYVIYRDYFPMAAKMVFGKALSICRDGQEILPAHFNTKYAVKILNLRGFECVFTDADRKYPPSKDAVQEGHPQLVTHYRRERNPSLSQRKKKLFKMQHGYLYCEKCGMIPIEEYGAIGEDCIEVHHIIPLSLTTQARQTTLDDLQCLCANCHRIEHARLNALLH